MRRFRGSAVKAAGLTTLPRKHLRRCPKRPTKGQSTAGRLPQCGGATARMRRAARRSPKRSPSVPPKGSSTRRRRTSHGLRDGGRGVSTSRAQSRAAFAIAGSGCTSPRRAARKTALCSDQLKPAHVRWRYLGTTVRPASSKATGVRRWCRWFSLLPTTASCASPRAAGRSAPWTRPEGVPEAARRARPPRGPQGQF